MEKLRKKLFKGSKEKRKNPPEAEDVDLVVAKQFVFDGEEKSPDEAKDKEGGKQGGVLRRRTSDGELYSHRQRRDSSQLQEAVSVRSLVVSERRPNTVYEIDCHSYETIEARRKISDGSLLSVGGGSSSRRTSKDMGGSPLQEDDPQGWELGIFRHRRKISRSCLSWRGSMDSSRSGEDISWKGSVDGRIRIFTGDDVPVTSSSPSRREEDFVETDSDTPTDTDDDHDEARDTIDTEITPTDSSEILFTSDQDKFATVRRRISICSLLKRCKRRRQSLQGLAAQPAAVNALSLPHIHQLSDYDEDNTNNDSAGENEPEPTDVVKSPNKRPDKSKKTKLKRRRAYYRTQKDGRSKSLTHIDTLGESGMLLPGEDMEGRSGDPSTDKLGVPDAHSVRRRKLSLANKVSSCEYMVVVLEYYVDPVEEFVQASRGTTLREALERRGIDVTNIQVYAEGSRSALSLNTDTYLLGGKTVRVRARDESRSPVRSRSAGTPGSQPHRKTSTSHRSGQGRFLWGGASTEDCSPLGEDRANGAPTSHEGSLKASKSKQNNRWSIFPSNTKDSKMDSLVQQLDLYSRQGIPKQPHLLTCQTYQIEQEVVVEDSWRTLVEGHEQLDDRQEQQQSAIWELVETEATYIHMLKVITDLFLSCLCNLQNESLLCEIDTDKLFSNIQEIYNANLTFWREHICRMLEVARSSRQPLDPSLLSDGFYKFDELFHPYTRYCLDQSHCQLYCKEKDHDNEYFKMYLAWCETQKECNRLRLVDILVQPMQRLTKYSLLLKAILKKTNLEDHKLILQDMITHVENFVSDVNSALRHKHEQERLRDIAKRIEAYEAVEARDDELERVVKSYSDLSLTQPMPGCPEHLPRHILHHGDLRLRDPHSSKMDVHVFLFTDLLLITKVTQRKAEKVKIIRPPYHVERLILVDLKDTTSIGLVSINEWNVAVAAFTLQCPDQRTHRTWHDALKRAKEQYREAQQARDVMIYDDMTCVGHLAPRSPRPGSSRASRVSSLAHSHSGSIDLNEHSPASTHHPPSFDMSEIRASSASSDDSIAAAEVEIQRSKSLESGAAGPATSPRPDRRPAFPKTPNTLSVIPPYSTGQSLPNLTVESANSLRVPNSLSNNPKALSPCNRGVSYPPPSPRTLRRSAPVPQSRNPPLIKTRHVTSMVGSPQDVDQADQDDSSRSGGPRRISRTDRMDNRRYHTAGAIDDIKKQDTKDATIHKRLSWNYGQGPPPTRDLGSDQGKLGRHKHAVKSVSCESMHSSSGVSSTSSLHRSMGSELETLENIDDNELEDGESTVVDLTVSDCTSLKISPHISTTYICHDSDITLGVCSQYITQPNSSTEPSEGCENLVKIDVSETDPGISSVQITVTEGATSSSSLNLSSSTNDGAPTKPDNMSMREILLNDASVEASYVLTHKFLFLLIDFA